MDTRIILVISFLVFCLGFQYQVLSQSNFYSTVSAKKVIAGASFEYNIVADNVKSARSFTAPNFEGLKIVSGPMQSSSTSIINGVRTSKQERIYSMIATKPGIYKIGKASAIINGKRTYSNTLKLEVVANNNKSNVSKSKQVFVKLIPSDTIVHIGQQLTLNYIIYTQVSVQSASIAQESDYNGFYKEDNIRFSRSNSIQEISGIQYHTSIIRQVCLYPQQTGKYDISEAVFKIGIAKTKNDQSRRSFFFRNNLDFQNVITNNLKIQVKDVPSPAPEDYIGGVGNFSIQANLDRNQVQNNKAFNLIVIYEGDGDPKMFQPSSLNLGNEFEIYEPILLEEQKKEISNRQIFSKKYQYTIVPKKEGKYQVSAKASYYNPDIKQYVRISKGPFGLQVLKGKAKEVIVDNSTQAELKKNWAVPDIEYKQNGYNKKGTNGFLLFSIFAFIGMVSTKIYQTMTSDERSERNRKKELHDRVIKRLRDAKSYKDNDNKRAFHDEIFKTIQKYLSEKFGMDIGNISTQKVKETLIEKEVSNNIIENINILLTESQLAIFGGIEHRTMQESFDMISKVIEELEGENT